MYYILNVILPSKHPRSATGYSRRRGANVPERACEKFAKKKKKKAKTRKETTDGTLTLRTAAVAGLGVMARSLVGRADERRRRAGSDDQHCRDPLHLQAHHRCHGVGDDSADLIDVSRLPSVFIRRRGRKCPRPGTGENAPKATGGVYVSLTTTTPPRLRVQYAIPMPFDVPETVRRPIRSTDRVHPSVVGIQDPHKHQKIFVPPPCFTIIVAVVSRFRREPENVFRFDLCLVIRAVAVVVEQYFVFNFSSQTIVF